MVKQFLGLVSLVVRDYDEALAFYVGTLGFSLIEDTYVPEQDKRWVVVEPPGSAGMRLLLARAANEEQSSRVGNQTGGRVFLFLYTDDFWRDYNAYREKGVEFVREPKEQSYGTVAVFKDLYGNLWDLVGPAPSRWTGIRAERTRSAKHEVEVEAQETIIDHSRFDFHFVLHSARKHLLDTASPCTYNPRRLPR